MVSWSKKDAVERNRTYQKNFQEKRRKELGNEEYKKQRAEIVKKYSNSKEKLHLILKNYIKILSFKGEATVKEVVNVMKETIPDLTENKVKKIWCGILQPR